MREEKHIQYLRSAVAEVREKGAQVAFLLEPTPVDEISRIAFSGGAMSKNRRIFYPKLLTGIAIYRL